MATMPLPARPKRAKVVKRAPAPTAASPLTKVQVVKLLANQQPGVHSLLAWCARVERDRRAGLLAKAS